MQKLWIGMNERGWENYDNLLQQTRGVVTTISLWSQLPQGTLLGELGSQLAEAPAPSHCQLSSMRGGMMGMSSPAHPGYALPSDLHAYVLTILDALRSVQGAVGPNASISECIGRCVEAHRLAQSRLHSSTWRLRESSDEPGGRGVQWRLAAISSPY